MKKNMGRVDTWIRILIALVIIVLFYLNKLSSPWDIILLIVGIVMLLTSLLGYCPIYTPLKIDTRKKEEK